MTDAPKKLYYTKCGFLWSQGYDLAWHHIASKTSSSSSVTLLPWSQPSGPHSRCTVLKFSSNFHLLHTALCRLYYSNFDQLHYCTVGGSKESEQTSSTGGQLPSSHHPGTAFKGRSWGHSVTGPTIVLGTDAGHSLSAPVRLSALYCTYLLMS